MHQPTVRVAAGPKKSGRVKGKAAIKEFVPKERERKREKEKGRGEEMKKKSWKEQHAHTSYQMLT